MSGGPNPRQRRALRDPMLPDPEETPEPVEASVERMSNEGGVAPEIPHDTQEYKGVDEEVKPE
ncbi:hypothetical protein [Alicyclobacillus shizuokensis]|uniref:hypothetical protein n=1 Tax=Alicyclobacillus shizuokensis TaxID=392014 RepID=UPI0008326B39|nr:hypothetical protein [Alicyclobacillus shizuokensis]MCL6627542.1 hypothetical protein [Alicyclobacillus shizuokensis]